MRCVSTGSIYIYLIMCGPVVDAVRRVALYVVVRLARLTAWRRGFKVSGKRDSDPRPQPWQGCALPTELFPHVCVYSPPRLMCGGGCDYRCKGNSLCSKSQNNLHILINLLRAVRRRTPFSCVKSFVGILFFRTFARGMLCARCGTHVSRALCTLRSMHGTHTHTGSQLRAHGHRMLS